MELVIKPLLTGADALFHIEQAGMDDEIWGLIERHFTRLKLVALYNDRTSDEIGEMLAGGAVYVTIGGPDVRAFMRGQATNDRRIFGRNNWRAVLQRALADHPDLEDWVAAVPV